MVSSGAFLIFTGVNWSGGRWFLRFAWRLPRSISKIRSALKCPVKMPLPGDSGAGFRMLPG